MSEERYSFRNIAKSISIFGGVQVYQIVISIIRSKIVALLLGPFGIGIEGLFNSTVGIIQRATNFGLNISAIRDLAEANETGDQRQVSIVVIVLRRLIWITGIIGTIVTIILAPWLSKLAFNNSDYTFSFVWISITLLFSQLSAGQLDILQGLRKIRALAKANLIGSTIGLLVGVPLYYWLGIKAIVPNIIIVSFSALLVSWFYAKGVKIEKLKVSKEQTYEVGKKMLILGFFLSVTAFIGLAADYILRLIISNKGNVAQVGLYSAGFAILNNYVGLIFTAMSTEYYPRLTGVAKDNEKCIKTINQQCEMSLIIMAPMIISFILFINVGLILLYSSEFLSVSEMLRWAAIGMLPRAAAWAIGFVYLAKGDSKIFITVNIAANTMTLLINILFYNLLGLTGLGVSFVITNFLILVINVLVSRRYYQFKFEKVFIQLFIYLNVFVIVTFWVINFSTSFYAYLFGIGSLVGVAIYSFIQMDKRVGIRHFFLKKNK